MKFFRIIAIFFLLVFPLIMVSLPGIAVWIGRAIAVSSPVLFATLGIFWLGISPKSQMIREGARLSEPRFSNVRPIVEKGMRLLFVTFGVFWLFEITVPLTSDLLHLAFGEKRASLTATVFDRSTAFLGVLFGERSVRFRPDGKSYYLLYSWRSPLHVGESYEFIVPPRSRMILDFREVRPVGDR